MKLDQVSDNCFAVLNERNRMCDANSGLNDLGVVIDDRAAAFGAWRRRSGIRGGDPTGSQTHLYGLPESELAAREMLARREAHRDELPESKRPTLESVRLHEPIEVAALFVFALTPRHLESSAKTTSPAEIPEET
jgi:hypothetical protein